MDFKKIHLLFFLFGLFLLPTLSAQPTFNELRETAETYRNVGRYRDALDTYLKAQDAKAGTTDFRLKIAQSAYEIGNFELASQYLAAVLTTEKMPDPLTYYFLGKIAHQQLNFKEASKNYKLFLSKTKNEDLQHQAILGELKRCASGIRITTLSEIALVENLGEGINTLADEYAPILSPNTDEKLYFSSNREGSEGGLRNVEGLADEQFGNYSADMYVTAQENGDWLFPTPIPSVLLNSARNEKVLDFSSDGKAMYFARSNRSSFILPDVLVDTYGKSEEVRSEVPKLRSPMNGDEGDNAMCLFRDSILIFSSRRPIWNNLGGYDLLYTTFREGAWTQPKNFGEKINSPYDETCPFLAKDGRTLYFSSNNVNSIGGFDIFKSVYNDATQEWSDPQNIGKPINSAGDDLDFRLSKDGMKAYLSSDRKIGGMGGKDIYVALFKKFQEEQTDRPSFPIAFTLVQEYKELGLLSPNKNNDGSVKTRDVNIEPMFYENDDDILRPATLKQLKNIGALVKEFPSLQVILIGNTNESERPTYDLYFTIKRLEKLAKILTDNGVPNSNLTVKSNGSSFQIARNEMEGLPSVVGQRLNKRFEIRLAALETVPNLKVTYSEPAVSELIVSTGGKVFARHQSGLSYKVQVAAVKRLYEADVINQYPSSMAEISQNDNTIYQYTIGLSNTFEEANKLKNEIVKGGLKDAFVIAYIDGVRILPENAKGLIKKFPDLANFVGKR